VAYLRLVRRNEHVMTTELWLLVASVILGLVHLIAASHLISFQYGYRWTASSREGASSAPARSRESGGPSNNEFFGNLPVLCRSGFSGACHSTSQLTHLLGCEPYFWARLGYLLAAAAGYALLRSLLFWNTALIGIAFFVIALFR